jgi:hypothetical protein
MVCFPLRILASAPSGRFLNFLAALAGAFPDSDGATTAALEKYRVEQKVVPSNNPKTNFTSGELMADTSHNF